MLLKSELDPGSARLAKPTTHSPTRPASPFSRHWPPPINASRQPKSSC